jgi:hypothetical protein
MLRSTANGKHIPFSVGPLKMAPMEPKHVRPNLHWVVCHTENICVGILTGGNQIVCLCLMLRKSVFFAHMLGGSYPVICSFSLYFIEILALFPFYKIRFGKI